jgi:hypothetical protein
MILARSHAPRDSLQAIHCAVEGMDAKRSAAVLLSSPAAAQRCAEAQGWIAVLWPSTIRHAVDRGSPPHHRRHDFHRRRRLLMAPQLCPRIYTRLTDVTGSSSLSNHAAAKTRSAMSEAAKELRFFADGAAKKWPLRGSLNLTVETL